MHSLTPPQSSHPQISPGRPSADVDPLTLGRPVAQASRPSRSARIVPPLADVAPGPGLVLLRELNAPATSRMSAGLEVDAADDARIHFAKRPTVPPHPLLHDVCATLRASQRHLRQTLADGKTSASNGAWEVPVRLTMLDDEGREVTLELLLVGVHEPDKETVLVRLPPGPGASAERVPCSAPATCIDALNSDAVQPPEARDLIEALTDLRHDFDAATRRLQALARAAQPASRAPAAVAGFAADIFDRVNFMVAGIASTHSRTLLCLSDIEVPQLGGNHLIRKLDGKAAGVSVLYEVPAALLFERTPGRGTGIVGEGDGPMMPKPMPMPMPEPEPEPKAEAARDVVLPAPWRQDGKYWHALKPVPHMLIRMPDLALPPAASDTPAFAANGLAGAAVLDEVCAPLHGRRGVLPAHFEALKSDRQWNQRVAIFPRNNPEGEAFPMRVHGVADADAMTLVCESRARIPGHLYDAYRKAGGVLCCVYHIPAELVYPWAGAQVPHGPAQEALDLGQGVRDFRVSIKKLRKAMQSPLDEPVAIAGRDDLADVCAKSDLRLLGVWNPDTRKLLCVTRGEPAKPLPGERVGRDPEGRGNRHFYAIWAGRLARRIEQPAAVAVG